MSSTRTCSKASLGINARRAKRALSLTQGLPLGAFVREHYVLGGILYGLHA